MGSMVEQIKGVGQMAFTALGKKVPLSWVVLEFVNLYLFLDGGGTNSSYPGWVGSAAIQLAFLWSRPEYIESRYGLLTVLLAEHHWFSFLCGISFL